VLVTPNSHDVEQQLAGLAGELRSARQSMEHESEAIRAAIERQDHRIQELHQRVFGPGGLVETTTRSQASLEQAVRSMEQLEARVSKLAWAGWAAVATLVGILFALIAQLARDSSR
jgi:cell division septum initiation protein DivIVA